MQVKMLKILIPISLLFFLGSCAVQTLKVDAYKKTKQVALISIMTENPIDTKNVDGGSLLAMAAKMAQGSEATDMKDKMDEVKSQLLKNAPSIFGFKIVPESQVIGQKSYKSIDDSSKNMTNLIAPEGYKRIFVNEKDAITKAIGSLKNVDAGMIVTMKPYLVKGPDIMGVGNVNVQNNMTFYLVDKAGEMILYSSNTEQSDTSTKRYAGFFRTADLKNMVGEALTKNLKAVKTWIDTEMAKPKK